MSVATAIIWVCVVFCLLAAVSATWSWRRTLRSCRRMRALWTDEAPPVEPVEVVLKTGEKVRVQPTNVHKAFVWQVRMPAEPDLVESIDVDTLPPWTNLVPIPPSVWAVMDDSV